MDRQTSPSPMAAAAESDAHYVPHDVFDETTNTAIIGLGSGLFLAAIRNAMSKRNVGAMSVFTRGAPIIGLCAAGPSAYTFFSRTTMNLREKDDAWAAAFGGFMCGGILGLPWMQLLTRNAMACAARRMPVVLGLGAVVSTIQGTLYYLGGRIDSFRKEDDEFERKEIIRRTTRVPVEQTIAEIGEGRGIKPPGYEERRRERIKEKYGFEINPVKATVDDSQ